MVFHNLGISIVQALDEWKSWIFSIKETFNKCPVWFVAHNGNQYDVLILFRYEAVALGSLPGTFFNSVSNRNSETMKYFILLQCLFFFLFLHFIRSEL